MLKLPSRSVPALFASVLCTAGAGAYADSADLLLTNARIYTVNESQPWATSLAVTGTDISFVGSDADAADMVGPDTEVVDLDGRLVLPGLVSGHEHPLLTAAVKAALYIPYSENKEKMLNAVRDHLEENPDDGPFWSFGGSYEGRVDITRQDIDEIISDKPFVMVAASGHGAWINSKALEMIGVTRDTPDPIDTFERDADGTPNGYLSSSAAAMYAVNALGLIRKQDVQRNLVGVIEYYNSYGFTAVQDAGQSPGSEDAVLGAAMELEQKGRLNLRIHGAAMAQRPIHLEGAFAALEKYSPMLDSEMLTVNTLKIHGGSVDGFSSPMLEPYSDRPDYSGPEIFPYSVRLEATMKAAKSGYAVHTHVIGDKAIRQALDAFQAVREAGYDDARLSTGHSSWVHPDDQPRYAEHNVTCNVFATKNAVHDETNFSRVGAERMKYMLPMKSLVKHGTRLAMSADAPTAPLDPWLQMEVAMLRKEPDHTKALHPEQGLSLEEVIEAYTMGATYQINWEDIIGSLEVGKRADLVVVDQNIFEVDPSQIHRTRALVTMLNGQVVYRRDTEDHTAWIKAPDTFGSLPLSGADPFDPLAGVKSANERYETEFARFAGAIICPLHGWHSPRDPAGSWPQG